MNLLLVLLALLLATPAYSASYYISPTGNNGNAGTSASIPWQTFNFAIAQLRAGDTLFLLDGEYTSSTTGFPLMDCSGSTFSGTASAPIIFKAQNEHKAHLVGTGGLVVYVYGCSYWVVEGLYVSNVDAEVFGSDGSGITAEVSDHITVRRNLIYGPNAWFNSHGIQYLYSHQGLIEENEIYYVHRHGIMLFGSFGQPIPDGNTVRRNYTHSRHHADMPGGCGETPPSGCSDAVGNYRGDTGISCYPCKNSIFENNIAEDFNSGFDIQCKTDCANNKYYGNMTRLVQHAYQWAARTDSSSGADIMPTNVVMAHNYAGALDLNGACVEARAAKNLTVTAQTCIGGTGAGFSADPGEGGDGSQGFTGTNILVRGFDGKGLDITGQGTWSLDYAGLTNNTGGYTPALTDSHITNERTSDPLLGTCQVYLPDSSPYKTLGLSGGQIGATILYRYQDGVLGTTPLWDTGTGAFTACGVIVAGVNDTTGNSCQNAHLRFTVGQGGCALPASYTGVAAVPSLLALLHLDAGTGTTAVDSTGHGYDGTLVNNPTWSAGRVGRYGVSFGATGQYIDIAKDVTITQYSWALSVRGVAAPSASASSQPLGAHTTDSLGFQWDDPTPAERQVIYHRTADGTFSVLQLPTPLVGGVWYRIASTYDGSTLKAYLNGVLQASVAVGPPGLIGPLHLGGNATTGAFTGSVDELRMWDYALSAADLLQDYRSTAGAPRHRLLRW